MNPRILLTLGAALLIPCAALAQGAPDPDTDLSTRAQQRLAELGFYRGPINGDIGPNTQAALAQFQLSVPLPASGSLDDQTLAALGLERSVQAAAGATAEQPGSQGASIEPNAKTEASSGGSTPAAVKGN
jgi:peptidoglycan hydrolase-like protein with peptidoglycan-binding domain